MWISTSCTSSDPLLSDFLFYFVKFYLWGHLHTASYLIKNLGTLSSDRSVESARKQTKDSNLHHIYWGSTGQDKSIISRKRQGQTFSSKTDLLHMEAEGKEEEHGEKSLTQSTTWNFQPSYYETAAQAAPNRAQCSVEVVCVSILGNFPGLGQPWGECGGGFGEGNRVSHYVPHYRNSEQVP